MAAQQQALGFRLVGPLGLNVTHVVPWGLVVGFAALVAGLLAVGSGHTVELIFPAGAVLVGAAAYFQHPTLYLGFTWWLWFLTPEVRRLVDYQIGWNPISPVMIAPYLVAGLAALTLVRCLPQLAQRPALFPFALILTGLNYGYAIGLVRAGPLGATYGLLTWIVPVIFGFHVAAHWQRYPLYRDAMQRVFLWGVLAMGVYGIVQFFVVPPWDAYWMEVAPMGSIGSPQPFEIRVWSTMNSPAPFAVAMMAGLLFTIAAKGPLRLLAGAAGYVSLLLSLVRAAWLGWAIGAVFLLAKVRGLQKMRLLAIGVLLFLLGLPLLLVNPVTERVTSRFETMQDIQQDDSYQARLALYSGFVLRSSTNVVGEGIGSTSLATKLANDGELGEFGIIDSGVLEIMFVLGWPGTVLFVGGLCWLLRAGLVGGIPPDDIAAQAARAVALATVAQLLFDNTLIGVPGMIFWSFLGLVLAAKAFHRERTRVSSSSDAGETERSDHDLGPAGAGWRTLTKAGAVGLAAGGSR